MKMGSSQRIRNIGGVRSGAVVALAIVIALASAACGRSPFVRYSPTADLVPALDDRSSIHLGTPGTLNGPGPFLATPSWCDDDNLEDFAESTANGSDWRAVSQRVPGKRSRIVYFSTKRFDNTEQYDDQFERYTTSFSEPCISPNGKATDFEPVQIERLPAGAISAHWPDANSDEVTTILGDRDRLVMMAVIWLESPDDVPVDAFADVVNTAWSDFLAANS